MPNRLKLSLLVLSIAIGVSAAYVFVVSRRHAQRQAAAMTLIRDLDSVDQQLWQASREFGFALNQLVVSAAVEATAENATAGNPTAGNPTAGDAGWGDTRVVRQSHRTLIESVDRSIAVVSRLTAPESEHGAALIAAQRKFLLVQRGIIREDFGKLVKLLENGSLPASQRDASIERIVDAAYLATEQEFTSVHAAREQFAKEFAIRLTAP